MQKYILNESNGMDTIIIYIPNILDNEFYNELKNEVVNYNDWYCGYNYNNNAITRRQKWYQKDGLSFCREWKVKYDRWNSFKYTNNLLKLEDIIENKVNNLIVGYNKVEDAKFNSLLINYYENGNNFITAHQDCKESFGYNPTIAIFSIGDKRNIKLERTKYNSLARNKNEYDKNLTFNLEDNSLFIMGGGSQLYYCHSIEKEESKKKRYSFSFRNFINI